MKAWNCRGIWPFQSWRSAYRAWPVAWNTRLVNPRVPLCFQGRSLSTEHQTSPPFTYAIFDTIAQPKNDVAAWTLLLDGALPAHLRISETSTPPISLDAVGLAEILLAAQYPSGSFFHSGGIDLLFHLGFNQGRWDAVVWLVKSLVENFPLRHTRIELLSQAINQWPSHQSLDIETASPIRIRPNVEPRQSDTMSLYELTGGPMESTAREGVLHHNALGQIWRSLGTMTQACAGGDIRPEVLELIAYIHHHGFMPEAIYRYTAPMDKCAIHQPPLLSLLSSRILTSLSDAAWRAHERTVLNAAAAETGKAAPSRPEFPGSVYRVNVAGLRPEVWLELILWSSLHGGWITHGAAILGALIQEKDPRQWKPLSWQEYGGQIASAGDSAKDDWESWDFIFKTRGTSTMDAPDGPNLPVERTVSAEVVNAYIDALVNNVSVGVGERGFPMESIVAQLHQFKNFLGRAKLGINTGTWDALILRMIDSQSIIPEQQSGTVQNMISLSPGIGQGLESRNTTELPAYVLDGNAAMQGLLHRALFGQIAVGNLDGAMNVFRALQDRTDSDKRRSLVSFMSGRSSSLLHRAATRGMFTNNFPGIDYPALDMQISPIVLGRFLDLVTNAKAYDFGKWLLHSSDVDGPVIRKHLYKDANLRPAIIRFAAETDDRELLSEYKGDPMSIETLRSLFDSQVNAKRWGSAVRILKHMDSLHHVTWSVANLANLGKTILLNSQGSKAKNIQSNGDVQWVKAIFTDMIRGKYDGVRPKTREHSIQTLLWIMSISDPEWAKFCTPLRLIHGPINFSIGSAAFNSMLQGTAEAFGSARAKMLLETFWPPSVRDALRSHYHSRDRRGRIRLPRYRPEILRSIARQRIVLHPFGMPADEAEVVVLGGLVPISSTFLVILYQALEEHRVGLNDDRSADVSHNISTESDDRVSVNTHQDVAEADADVSDTSSPRDIVAWALREMREVDTVDDVVLRQIDRSLSEQGLDDLRAELPAFSLVVVEEDG